MKTVTSTEAKAKLNAILAEVDRTGVSVTITTHGRPVAVLSRRIAVGESSVSCLRLPCRKP